MTNKTIEPPPAKTVPNPQYSRPKFGDLLRTTDRSSNVSSLLSDDASSSSSRNINSSTSVPSSPATNSPRRFSLSDGLGDSELIQNSPYIMSPWNEPSPYIKSPWKKLSPSPQHRDQSDAGYVSSRYRSGLLGSLLREEGHISSLAASGGMLYTGSGSKNIRVWKEFRDSGGFKSNSGLVKAIVVCPESAHSKKNVVFTGHQDGKIRVWKSVVSANTTKRIGSLPTLKDYLKTSMNPKKYVSVRRHRNVPCVRHFDAVSCLCLNVESGLLYSGSWDKTIKVWRLSDSKCLESFPAHEDAINSIAVRSIDGIVLSGSADGKVKVWRQELRGKRTSHFYVQTLLSQESAITSLAVSWKDSQTVYCGSSDGLVNFWERDKGWLSYGGVLRGHKMAVLCLVTAGECLLFSGSADNSICVWKREDGGVHSCLSVLTGHCGPVKCLAVEEDRAGEEEEELDGVDRSWIVYSGSLDKSVKVWRVYENENLA